MAHARGQAVEAVHVAKGSLHHGRVEGRGFGEVLDDGRPRAQAVLDTARGHVDALPEHAGCFVVVTAHGLHEVRVTVEGHAADDGQAHVRVDGVDEVAVRVEVVRIDDRQVGRHAGRDTADVLLPVGGVSRVGGDHAHHFFVGENVPEDFVVPQVGDLELMQGRLAARGRPVRRQRDVDARSLGRSHVGGVTVEQQVGQGRPDEAGADLTHLLEFGGRQGGSVDEDQLSDQEIVGHEDIEFGSAGFVHALAEVKEPRVQFLAGVAGLDVVPNVIRFEFRDLGVDLVSAEVPILDVARQHAGVGVVGVGRCALGGGGPADDHLGFDVLHGGEFEVEVGTSMQEHLRFGDEFAVVGVVLPLVAVLITAPLVGR